MDKEGFQLVSNAKKVFRPVQQHPKTPSSGLADILPMRNDFNVLENIVENIHEDLQDDLIVPALGTDPIPGDE